MHPVPFWLLLHFLWLFCVHELPVWVHHLPWGHLKWAVLIYPLLQLRFQLWNSVVLVPLEFGLHVRVLCVQLLLMHVRAGVFRNQLRQVPQP